MSENVDVKSLVEQFGDMRDKTKGDVMALIRNMMEEEGEGEDEDNENSETEEEIVNLLKKRNK